MTKSQSQFNHEQLQIGSITFHPVVSSDGHLGFVSFVINDCLKLNSIAVYRKLNGGFRLLYPSKKIGIFPQTIFQPLTPKLSRKIEEQVFAHLNHHLFQLPTINQEEGF